MDCRQIEQYLSLYLDNELGSGETKQVEEHLQECPACMEYYRSLKMIKQYCSNLKVVDLPSGFHEKLHQRLVKEERKQMSRNFKFKIAIGIVAALVLVFVGIGLSDGIGSNKEGAYEMAASDTATSESKSSAGGDVEVYLTEETTEDYAAVQDSYESEKNLADSGVSGQEEADKRQAGSSVGIQSSIGERKIIKSAYLSVETLEFDRFINTITGKLNSVGGYVESSNIDGIPHNAQNKVLRSAHFEIRVPKEYFQQFITDVGGLGNLLIKQENGDDITGQYFDTEARLKSLQIQEERLLTILQKAEKLQDIIELERELSNVRYEIENLTGTLKKWDNMVEYSRISLDVYEVKELKEEESYELTWGQRIVKAFTESLEKLVDLAKDLVVFLASALPYFVILGVIGWIVWEIVKHYRIFRENNKKGDGMNE